MPPIFENSWMQPSKVRVVKSLWIPTACSNDLARRSFSTVAAPSSNDRFVKSVISAVIVRQPLFHSPNILTAVSTFCCPSLWKASKFLIIVTSQACPCTHAPVATAYGLMTRRLTDQSVANCVLALAHWLEAQCGAQESTLIGYQSSRILSVDHALVAPLSTKCDRFLLPLVVIVCVPDSNLSQRRLFAAVKRGHGRPTSSKVLSRCRRPSHVGLPYRAVGARGKARVVIHSSSNALLGH